MRASAAEACNPLIAARMPLIVVVIGIPRITAWARILTSSRRGLGPGYVVLMIQPSCLASIMSSALGRPSEIL